MSSDGRTPTDRSPQPEPSRPPELERASPADAADDELVSLEESNDLCAVLERWLRTGLPRPE